MLKHQSPVAGFAFLFAIGASAGASESVPDILRRQTQELIDAITTGSAAVWDRYLDEDLRYVDESGTVMTKKQMVEGTKPLPEGVSGSIKVTGFDAVVHGNVAVATYVRRRERRLPWTQAALPVSDDRHLVEDRQRLRLIAGHRSSRYGRTRRRLRSRPPFAPRTAANTP
jgi:hypothetical protein